MHLSQSTTRIRDDKKNQIALAEPGPQHISLRWHSAFAVDEAQHSSPPDSCQLSRVPHCPREKQLRAEPLGFCRACAVQLWELTLQLKSRGMLQITCSQQTLLPLHWQLIPALGSLLPSLCSIQPPYNLSPWREQCVVQSFSLPGTSMDSCPTRSKSGCTMVVFPSPPGYSQTCWVSK